MDTIETFKPVYQRFLESGMTVCDFCKSSNLLESRFYYYPLLDGVYNSSKKSRHFKMRLMDSKEKTPCKHLFEDIIINPYGEVYACCGIGVCHIPQMRLGNIHQEPIQTIYERAFEDVLKIWLYTEGPQDVLAFVKKKTGQKFNWHTRHNCDICRTIFTDKSILPILRDNVFEAASLPLLFYHCKAKTENERRTKQ